MKVYGITSDQYENGSFFFPTKKAAITECKDIENPAEVREIEIRGDLTGRAYACLLLNGSGFAKSQKVVFRNKAMIEWAGSETGASLISQLDKRNRGQE